MFSRARGFGRSHYRSTLRARAWRVNAGAAWARNCYTTLTEALPNRQGIAAVAVVQYERGNFSEC